jgi:DNA-binding LacI/PurR family transcriptional regulator
LQTVSNAINAPHLLRPKTLARVLASIEELQYVPNQAARSLRTKFSGAIGYRVFPPDRRGSGGVMDRFLYALSDTARSAGDGLMCHTASSDEDEITIFDRLWQQRSVDGIVIANTHYDDPRPDWLLQHRVPFVAFGRPWGRDLERHSWVDVDGAAGTRDATLHLIEQGHRRVAFLGPPKPEDRRSGWRRAMRAMRLPTRGLNAMAQDSIASGASAAHALLDAGDPATGFVCETDAIAIGVLRTLDDHGLRAGADVGVVGFDDSIGAQLVRPGLSSVNQPLDVAAAHIVRILLSHLADRSTPEHVVLRPELIVRGSSQRD